MPGPVRYQKRLKGEDPLDPTPELRDMLAMATAARKWTTPECPGGHGELIWGKWEPWIRCSPLPMAGPSGQAQYPPWCGELGVDGHCRLRAEDIGRSCSGFSFMKRFVVHGRACSRLLFLSVILKVNTRACRLVCLRAMACINAAFHSSHVFNIVAKFDVHGRACRLPVRTFGNLPCESGSYRGRSSPFVLACCH